jgi:LNS2 (Lipin/Ned1/Smp2)
MASCRCCTPCCCSLLPGRRPPQPPFQGEAFDLILIQSADDPSLIECGDVLHSFDMLDLPDDVRSACTLTLEVKRFFSNDGNDKTLKFPIINSKICLPQAKSRTSPQPRSCPPMERGDDFSSEQSHQHKYSNHDRQALQLLASSLQSGNYSPHYVLRSNGGISSINDNRNKNCDYYYYTTAGEQDDDGHEDDQGVVIAMASGFSIHLWSSTDRVVVFDIDGTITRSNIRGFIDTIVTETYLYTHDGVCQFAQELSSEAIANGASNNGKCSIRFVYLSSRPYATASGTRKFLAEMRQRQHRLPAGPLLGSAKTVCQVIYMERVTRDAHVFKGSTLLSNIVRPWRAVVGTAATAIDKDARTQSSRSNSHAARDLFLAGFGNQTSDAHAYHEAGMDPCQIFVIDKQSQIRCLDGGGVAALRVTNDYARLQGTHFVHGYRDKKLRKHVFRNVTSAQEAPLLPIV